MTDSRGHPVADGPNWLVCRGRPLVPGTSPDAVYALKAKAAVWLLDGWCCVWCGRPVRRYPGRADHRPDQATVDHVVMWADGGRDSLANLVTACHTCNEEGSRADTLGRPIHRTPPEARTRRALLLDLEIAVYDLWQRRALGRHPITRRPLGKRNPWR